jgi:dTDP-4-dehydrorhamnose reductase
MMRAVLVTGATGQLGIELACAAWPAGWTAVAFDRAMLDLADPVAIRACIAAGHDGTPWTAVINGAAYTAVDKAEADIVTAWTINTMAPAVFAESCAAADIPLVQVSTDYVFSGDKAGAWEVDDPVAPLGVYGASKLGGELAVRTSGVRHAIVRTAWVVSAHGSNFVRTMLRVAEARDQLAVVNDQRGSPTAAADLAQALATIAVRLADDPHAPSGTFHFSNAGDISWADFAIEIFRQSALRGGPSAEVARILSSDYPTPARRPANSRLSHTAIHDAYGIVPRDWREGLSDILDQLIGTPR